MNAVETARAIARSDLAEALKDPKMTGRGLMVFRNAVAIAENDVLLQETRAAEAAAEAAERAKVAQAQRETDAAAEKAAAEEAARERLAAIIERFHALQAELAEDHTGIELIAIRTNRPIGATLDQARIRDIPAALGLPSKIEEQRIAAHHSQAEAHRLGTIEINRMATATQRGAQMREALSGPGLPQRGTLLQNRGNVLN